MANTVSVEVISTNGTVDIEATVASLRSTLTAQQVAVAEETEVIASVVSEVFNEHKGQFLKIGRVISLALTRLNVQNENFSTLEERVGNYVRNNSRGRGAALFVVKQGRGGGFGMISDLPVATTDTETSTEE